MADGMVAVTAVNLVEKTEFSTVGLLVWKMVDS
jgi:hypothetical protein